MTNEEYINHYKESHRRVNNFAFKALKAGVKLLTMAQPPEDNPDRIPDQGDLMLIGRVEHKVRNIDFTCREDYPYPSVAIDELYKVNNKPDKPIMYVIENKSGTHAAVIYSYTKQHWYANDTFDWKRQRKLNLLMISKNYVRFCKIDDVF